jgi:glycosyltransferase involved in cell wall biosynthesis
VLYLGDTALRRGLLTAIDAVDLLRDQIKHLKLVIVGKSTTDDVLKERVKELQLEDHVVFEGWQDVNLFPSYITASDVCISPLYRSSQHDVAYANKLFQYMSFAKPVLVSDALAQKKLVEETKSGLIHKEKNAEDFAKKLMMLYKDPGLRKQLGEHGKAFIDEKFVWEKVSGNLIGIYNNMGK